MFFLAPLELQKDEVEDTQSEQEETFMPPPLEDPELNINHPYYDVARHGIIQLAGKFGKYYGFMLLNPLPHFSYCTPQGDA